MSKYNRNTVQGIPSINNELEKIQNAINDQLDRNPDVGVANEMLDDLDMNSNRIYNLGDPVDNKDAVTKEYVDQIAIDAGAQGVIPVEAGRQTGDGSTTVFTIPTTSDGSQPPARSYLVYLDGVHQKPVTDYNVLGTSITFVEAPSDGVLIDITFYEPAISTEFSANNLHLYTDYVFNSVADMKASLTLGGDTVILNVGDSVKTLGYYSPNDGGGAEYIVVAAATGTDDGGSYHDLDNGLQAKIRITDTPSFNQFGAKGDGIADDTSAISAAINSTWSFINDAAYVYRTTSRLTFDNTGQSFGGGFTFKYDGANTDRLADITADRVSFDNVVFDGNLGQVRFSMVYVQGQTRKPSFINCTFQNLRGTAKGTTQLNQQYALCIDYDRVEDIIIDNCTFRSLTSLNNNASGGAVEGLGFIGGIVVSTEDGNDPVSPQVSPSFGKITNCTFSGIVTELEVGLNQADRNTFDDGDGIRFYGVTGLSERANFHISDCYFNQCSKRAIKSAMQGVVVNDIVVTADSNTYPMTTIIKAHNNNEFSGINVNCATAAKEPDIFTQIFFTNQTNENGIKFTNINCPYTGTVLDLICEDATTDAANIYVDGVNCPSVSLRAFTQSGTVPNSINIFVDNVSVTGSAADTQGVVPFNGGWHFGRVQANDMDWKSTVGGTIEDLTLTINSGSFTGTGTNGLVELNGTNVGKLKIDASSLSSSFLDTRSRIVLLQGDNTRYDHLDITINEAMNTSIPHIEWMGDDTSISRFEYTGAGYMDIGTLVTSNGMEIGTCVRKGTGSISAPFLIAQNAATDNIVVGQCTDFRASTAASVRLVAGLKMVVANAMSRSTLSVTQDDTAGSMTVVNQTAF